MRVVGDLFARVGRIVLLKKLASKIVDELAELLIVPFVLALVVVDRILYAFQQLAN